MKSARPEGQAPMSPDMLAELVSAVEARTGRREGNEIRFLCPAHDDHRPSARYNPAKYVWLCDSCGASGGALELAERLGVSVPSRNGSKAKSSVTRYKVRDVDGQVVAVRARLDLSDGSKKPWWESPDGSLGLDGRPVTTLPLYGSERLPALSDGSRVVVTEGEKAAASLSRNDLAAVGSVTGAAVTPDDDALRPLTRFSVLLWPDNDAAGQSHMASIGSALLRLGCRDVGLVEWADAPDKGDAADFTGSDFELAALLDAAQPFESKPEIDLAALLADVQAMIRRYVVLTDAQAVAVALWTAHTHAIDAADVTPYLSINSPEKRSGKTRLMEILRRLVAHPWMTARTSTAALYRRVDADSPTLLLDESDAAFKGGGEYSETLRAVLNSGFERGGSTTVCVGQGKDLSYHEFQTFSAKAIAGIGKLPDTLRDRSISIAMKRQMPGEKAERLRRRRVHRETKPLHERLAEWASTAGATLADAEPAIPSELDDRAADGWEPLVAIADMAGGSWPDRARGAALALSVGDEREDSSLNIRLLADIWTLFERRDVDRLAIADLVAALIADVEAPWSDLKGKPLSTRSLGWRLRGYGIKATTIRLHTGETPRGYYRATFDDAVSRYLPEEASQSDTTDTLDRKYRDGCSARVGFESDTPSGTDTEIGHDVAVVTDVAVSDGMGEVCSICGSPNIDGYTIVDDEGKDGEPRCAGHHLRVSDGLLVIEAVEHLGAKILARSRR